MKKGVLILVGLVLTIMTLASCDTLSATPTERASPEPEVESLPVPTEQTSPALSDELLSVAEARALLIDWCEWNEVSYLQDMNQQSGSDLSYAFLVDYSSRWPECPANTYCYAWVNASTGNLHFEEAGYSETVGPNLYGNMPDRLFPIPMRDDVVVPYNWFSPPEYVWGVTYVYEDKDQSVMKSYQSQLEEGGFVYHGNVQSVVSLWTYFRGDDAALLIVELYYAGEMFSMNMYIDYQ